MMSIIIKNRSNANKVFVSLLLLFAIIWQACTALIEEGTAMNQIETIQRVNFPTDAFSYLSFEHLKKISVAISSEKSLLLSHPDLFHCDDCFDSNVNIDDIAKSFQQELQVSTNSSFSSNNSNSNIGSDSATFARPMVNTSALNYEYMGAKRWVVAALKQAVESERSKQVAICAAALNKTVAGVAKPTTCHNSKRYVVQIIKDSVASERKKQIALFEAKAAAERQEHHRALEAAALSESERINQLSLRLVETEELNKLYSEDLMALESEHKAELASMKGLYDEKTHSLLQDLQDARRGEQDLKMQLDLQREENECLSLELTGLRIELTSIEKQQQQLKQQLKQPAEGLLQQRGKIMIGAIWPVSAVLVGSNSHYSAMNPVASKNISLGNSMAALLTTSRQDIETEYYSATTSEKQQENQLIVDRFLQVASMCFLTLAIILQAASQSIKPSEIIETTVEVGDLTFLSTAITNDLNESSGLSSDCSTEAKGNHSAQQSVALEHEKDDATAASSVVQEAVQKIETLLEKKQVFDSPLPSGTSSACGTTGGTLSSIEETTAAAAPAGTAKESKRRKAGDKGNNNNNNKASSRDAFLQQLLGSPPPAGFPTYPASAASSSYGSHRHQADDPFDHLLRGSGLNIGGDGIVISAMETPEVNADDNNSHGTSPDVGELHDLYADPDSNSHESASQYNAKYIIDNQSKPSKIVDGPTSFAATTNNTNTNGSSAAFISSTAASIAVVTGGRAGLALAQGRRQRRSAALAAKCAVFSPTVHLSGIYPPHQQVPEAERELSNTGNNATTTQSYKISSMFYDDCSEENDKENSQAMCNNITSSSPSFFQGSNPLKQQQKINSRAL